MFKLNANFDADVLLYLLIHFESDGHTVHSMVPTVPTDSTVVVSLFTRTCAFQSTLLGCQSILHQVAQTVLIVTMAGFFLDRLFYTHTHARVRGLEQITPPFLLQNHKHLLL